MRGASWTWGLVAALLLPAGMPRLGGSPGSRLGVPIRKWRVAHSGQML